MKKILVLAMILAVVALGATEEEKTGDLGFLGFHFNPVTLASGTWYDYMNGAYVGFPIRIQDEGIINRGIYFTYMHRPALTADRAQRWAFATLDGLQTKEDTDLTDVQHHEGFGTLALCPKTGDAMFAWHAAPYDKSSNINNIHYTFDLFSATYTPGLNLITPAMQAVENVTRDFDKDWPPRHRNAYIWPVLYIGPSPKGADYNRVIIFSKSSESSFMPSRNNDRGFWPSSATLVSIADFRPEEIHDENFDGLVWAENEIAYFMDMHMWDGIDPALVGVQDPGARAFQSYTFCSRTGSAAIAGYLSHDSLIWTDHEDHDNFILYCDNFGNSFLDDTYRFVGAVFTHEFPEGTTPRWNREDAAGLPHEADIIAEMDAIENRDLNDISWLVMRNVVLSNQTLIFDKHGRLHVPMISSPLFQRASPDNYYVWPTNHQVHTSIFDPETGDWDLVHLFPRYEPAGDLKDKFPFTWDSTGDGYIDLVLTEDGTQIERIWPLHFPSYHHERSNMMHDVQLRSTEDNNGLMAVMWMDCFKARANHEFGSYPEYFELPEINIVVSKESGNSWSNVFKINSRDFPELTDIPQFIYPADKMIYLGGDKARLYFMYTAHTVWGNSINYDPISSAQADIRYVAVDFDLSQIPGPSKSVESVVPTSFAMLGQNYPNPFNPSTTIAYTLPAAGSVSLNVYNIRGQLVKNLVNTNQIAGEHVIVWNGQDNNNRSVASGIYFYKLEANGRTETRRMVLMK